MLDRIDFFINEADLTFNLYNLSKSQYNKLERYINGFLDRDHVNIEIYKAADGTLNITFKLSIYENIGRDKKYINIIKKVISLNLDKKDRKEEGYW